MKTLDYIIKCCRKRPVLFLAVLIIGAALPLVWNREPIGLLLGCVGAVFWVVSKWQEKEIT